MVQDMLKRVLAGLICAWQGSRQAMRGTSRRSVAPDSSGEKGLNRLTMVVAGKAKGEWRTPSREGKGKKSHCKGGEEAEGEWRTL